MNDEDKVELWRRRLFEGVVGLTAVVATWRAGEDLSDWLQLQADIFHGLPDRNDASVDAWKSAFFHAQALLEQFVVSRYGHAGIAWWVDATAQVYRRIESGGGGGSGDGRGVADVVDRIARQAELYASPHRVVHTSPTQYMVEIPRCLIWEYRERARRNGVPIILDSPCDYCTRAITANVRAMGFEAVWERVDGADGPGCHWQVSSVARRPV